MVLSGGGDDGRIVVTARSGSGDAWVLPTWPGRDPEQWWVLPGGEDYVEVVGERPLDELPPGMWLAVANPGTLGDMLWFTSTPVVSQRFAEALGRIGATGYRLLPLDVRQQDGTVAQGYSLLIADGDEGSDVRPFPPGSPATNTLDLSARAATALRDAGATALETQPTVDAAAELAAVAAERAAEMSVAGHSRDFSGRVVVQGPLDEGHARVTLGWPGQRPDQWWTLPSGEDLIEVIESGAAGALPAELSLQVDEPGQLGDVLVTLTMSYPIVSSAFLAVAAGIGATGYRAVPVSTARTPEEEYYLVLLDNDDAADVRPFPPARRAVSALDLSPRLWAALQKAGVTRLKAQAAEEAAAEYG